MVHVKVADVLVQVIGCSQLYRYFTVDAVGWPLQDLNPAKSDGWDIPQYPLLLIRPLFRVVIAIVLYYV